MEQDRERERGMGGGDEGESGEENKRGRQGEIGMGKRRERGSDVQRRQRARG